MGKGCEQAFLQGGYINSQYTLEKMLYNISHQGNANHDLEIPLHTIKMARIKSQTTTSVGKIWENQNLYILLVGI